MIKIDLKKVAKSFKGEEFTDQNGVPLTYGYSISLALTEQGVEGNRVKLYILAQKAYSDEFLEVDKADLEIIKKALEKSKTLSTNVIGQILLELD